MRQVFVACLAWLAAGQWFSPDTPVSSTHKTDRHDIAEILRYIITHDPLHMQTPTQALWKVSLNSDGQTYPPISIVRTITSHLNLTSVCKSNFPHRKWLLYWQYTKAKLCKHILYYCLIDWYWWPFNHKSKQNWSASDDGYRQIVV